MTARLPSIHLGLKRFPSNRFELALDSCEYVYLFTSLFSSYGRVQISAESATRSVKTDILAIIRIQDSSLSPTKPKNSVFYLREAQSVASLAKTHRSTATNTAWHYCVRRACLFIHSVFSIHTLSCALPKQSTRASYIGLPTHGRRA